MLSPSIQDTRAKLTDAYAGILALDGLARSCQSVVIVPIPDQPAWLAPVSLEVTQLDYAAAGWQTHRADVWAPVILAFEDFFAIFSGVAASAPPDGTAAFWLDILDVTLLPAVDKALAATQASQAEIVQLQQAFGVVLPRMDRSIEAGWIALASEESTMLTLAEQLGELTQTVQGLGDKLTSDAIATDKGISQSAVSLLYAAGAAGVEASVPIVGVVVAVLSIGKSLYDLIEDDTQIAATMQKINSTRQELTDEALAVALTKSTLQTLYSVEKQYLAVQDAIPGLVDLWTTQQAKIQDLIDALRAGADPALILDLETLPQALTAWQAINTFVTKVAAVDSTVGEPVTIDIAHATVRPTLPTQ